MRLSGCRPEDVEGPNDITEDVIRDLALPLGFVDIKVCAVDETWSGLKLVVRRELRSKEQTSSTTKATKVDSGSS